MKKILFLSLLGLPVLFLWGCSLINNNDNQINTWYIEKISQLEEQLSGLLEQFSWLQAENESLKETLSWAVSNLKTLQEENQKLISNQENNKITTKSNQIYSMADWIMYLNWNKIYWTNLKSYSFCTTNLEKKCKYGIEIIAENNNYLLFTAIESFNWEYYLSYLLDKTTNIAKSFELWDKLYTFDYKNWDDININVYDGWILWWNGAIRSKWYFNNFNCDECGITKTWTIQVNLNNLINYTTNQNYILIP